MDYTKIALDKEIHVFQKTKPLKYCDFEKIISAERLCRYVSACSNKQQKAMTLYRYNIKLSQEIFALISCFEVSLRNKIDLEMRSHFGSNWLRDLVLPGGRFETDSRVAGTKKIIDNAYSNLLRNNNYSNTKLLAEMEFGVWKFMFNNVQFRLSGRYLLNIFPNKPRSTRIQQYNNVFIFNELDCINMLRNRVAHHEPICFGNHNNIDLSKVTDCYYKMTQLLKWMDIDAEALWYGLDHIDVISNKIKRL